MIASRPQSCKIEQSMTPVIAKKYSLLTLLLLAFACGTHESGSMKTVTFRVQPQSLPPSSKIYIAGNHSKLGNWQANLVSLHEQRDGSWSRSFSFHAGTLLEFKITRGAWETEAVNAEGIEFPNFVLPVERDTTIVIAIGYWRDTFKRETFLSAQRLQNKGGNFELLENWKYHAGDNPAWAGVAYNDSAWEEANPALPPKQLPQSGWDGSGWFRLHLTVDSTLWNVPLAMYMFQTGASEVYLNGELLYQYGKVGSSNDTETAFRDPNPRFIIFGEQTPQVLAVRYSNHLTHWYNRIGIGAGFECRLGELNSYIAERAASVRQSTVFQMFFTAAFAAFAFVHFLLFAFYPRAKENLYYALAMAGFAIVAFTSFPSPLVTSVASLVQANKINVIGINMAIVFGVFTVYASVYNKFPRQYLLFVIIVMSFTLMALAKPLQSKMIIFFYDVFLAIVCLEIIRVIINSGFNKDRWDWITGLGFVIAMLAIIYQLLIYLGWARSLLGTEIVYVYGILALGITFSIRLSRDFAATHKNLEQQLVQVKELSAKTLEQERRAREDEIAKRLLEADNARKTQELEEARQLQLSMLPKEIPTLANLDIAVQTKTATEVGGDYYDFLVDQNGTLTVAIGDATGHGMKAGTLVASIKSLFNAFGNNFELPSFFTKCSEIIKSMHLGNLYMAMLLAKINGRRMTVSAAGMPPILIYRKHSGAVEEILLKGMPLGGPYTFDYPQEQTALRPGDAILFMSDGYPELFNDKNEMLDYPRIREIFREAAARPAAEVIHHLWKAGETWANGDALRDDTTLLVIKIKDQ